MNSVVTSIVSDLFPSLVDLVDDIYTSDKELAESELNKIKVANDYSLALMASELKLKELLVADNQSARSMQGMALKQDDLFSKRFLYYLAMSVIAVTLGMIYLLVTDKEISSSPNVNLVVGGLIGISSQVVQFFFGSSVGSKDKTELLSRRD